MRSVSLDLSLIGDCGRAALIDRDGGITWCCMPRLDGQPLLDRLLSGRGRWSFGALDLIGRSQRYLGRAPVVVTTHRSARGSYESVDFFPWRGPGRAGRCLVRLLRPLEGLPRVRMSFRPAARWGEDLPGMSRTPTGLVFDADWSLYQLHASPEARLYALLAGGALPLERPVAFVLGQLDPPEDLSAWAQEALDDTAAAWEGWLDGLELPRRWRDACARSAVVLKLCTDEDTGGIVTSLTTSIPEAPESGRCWDDRYCRLRGGVFAARELSRLGAHEAVAGWRRWLSAVLARDGAQLRPLYDLDGAHPPAEQIAEDLPGYRGMGPVRVGHRAAERVRYDVWGDVLAARIPGGAGELDPALIPGLEAELRRGDGPMRYAAADDLRDPEAASNLCTFWLIEALARSGRVAEAERLFEDILAARGAGGLLSGDRDPETGELWGNIPQVYAHAGILACAWALD